MESSSAAVSSADEAYSVWRKLKGVWPPTKPCKDDQAALDKVMTQLKLSFLVGKPCSVVYPTLQKILTNFDCDNSDTTPTIRHMCCSQCGGQPIPDVPAAPPTPTPGSAVCSVCKHKYDPARDGGGKKFEDLPSTWVCPVCGAPKSAYHRMADGTWAHTHDDDG